MNIESINKVCHIYILLKKYCYSTYAQFIVFDIHMDTTYMSIIYFDSTDMDYDSWVSMSLYIIFT